MSLGGAIGLVEAAYAVGFSGSFATLTWKADDAFTAEFKRWIAEKFRGIGKQAGQRRNWPALVGGVLDHAFGRDAYSVKFISRALATSIISVALFFGVYLSFTPMFFTSIVEDPFQREQVFRQLLSISLLTNCLTDYLCLCYCREVIWQMEHDKEGRHISYFLLKDIVIKAIIFTVSMAATYVMFAETEQSFGGSEIIALKALPLTLWEGFQFRNMSSVYIYAAIMSSFWLWGYLLSWKALELAAKMPRMIQVMNWMFPLDDRPIRSFGIVVSVIVMLGYILVKTAQTLLQVAS